jgi:hypothetical protein
MPFRACCCLLPAGRGAAFCWWGATRAGKIRARGCAVNVSGRRSCRTRPCRPPPVAPPRVQLPAIVGCAVRCPAPWNAAGAFKTSIGGMKTALELRRDPIILRNLFRMDVNDAVLPRKARTLFRFESYIAHRSSGRGSTRRRADAALLPRQPLSVSLARPRRSPRAPKRSTY